MVSVLGFWNGVFHYLNCCLPGVVLELSMCLFLYCYDYTRLSVSLSALYDCNFAVNHVCRRVKEQAMHLHEPMRAIFPLQSAIRKLQPSSEFLTAIHADFLQMCLLSKCYKASLSILEDDIFEIDQKRTALVPRDFLLYCYYGYVSYADFITPKFSTLFTLFSMCCNGFWTYTAVVGLTDVGFYNCRGMVYIGLKKFSKALEFFQHVLHLCSHATAVFFVL